MQLNIYLMWEKSSTSESHNIKTSPVSHNTEKAHVFAIIAPDFSLLKHIILLNTFKCILWHNLTILFPMSCIEMVQYFTSYDLMKDDLVVPVQNIF